MEKAWTHTTARMSVREKVGCVTQIKKWSIAGATVKIKKNIMWLHRRCHNDAYCTIWTKCSVALRAVIIIKITRLKILVLLSLYSRGIIKDGTTPVFTQRDVILSRGRACVLIIFSEDSFLLRCITISKTKINYFHSTYGISRLPDYGLRCARKNEKKEKNHAHP